MNEWMNERERERTLRQEDCKCLLKLQLDTFRIFFETSPKYWYRLRNLLLKIVRWLIHAGCFHLTIARLTAGFFFCPGAFSFISCLVWVKVDKPGAKMRENHWLNQQCWLHFPDVASPSMLWTSLLDTPSLRFPLLSLWYLRSYCEWQWGHVSITPTVPYNFLKHNQHAIFFCSCLFLGGVVIISNTGSRVSSPPSHKLQKITPVICLQFQWALEVSVCFVNPSSSCLLTLNRGCVGKHSDDNGPDGLFG